MTSPLAEGRAMRLRKTVVEGLGPSKYTLAAIACYEASVALWYAVSFAGVQVFTEGGPEDWHARDIDREHISRAVASANKILPVVRLVNPDVPNVRKYLLAYDLAVAECVRLNMPMAHSVCARFSKKITTGILPEDLLQEGVIGLIRAIRKFVPSKGFQFSTYVFYWIYQGVSRAAKDSHLIHTPLDNGRVKESLAEKATCARQLISINEEMNNKGVTDVGTERGNMIASKEFPSPEEVRAAHEDRRNLSAAMSSQLTPKEARILRLRFDDEYTLKEIGDILGCTRERVRQIECQALGKLRSFMDRDEANLPDLEQE